MSPIEIEVLLHHYYCPLNWSSVRQDSPAAGEATEFWLDVGCLEEVDDTERESGIQLTARGKAMVALWLRQTLPTCIWVDGKGEPIVMEGDQP